MCYKAPGPRCSAHAKEELKKAAKAYKESNSYEDYEKLKEAQDAFYTTPEGFKALEKEYEKTGDYMIPVFLRERRAQRDKQLRALQVFNDEGREIPNPSALVKRALSSDLSYDGEKPDWWNKYSQEAQNNKFQHLATAPELMDVFESPMGKIAVVWEDESQSERDINPVEKGMRISQCRFVNFDTGKDVGYLKVSEMDKSSLERVYGKDEFAPFRFYSQHSGSGASFPFDPLASYYGDDNEKEEEFNNKSREDKRRQMWVACQKSMGNGITHKGEYLSSVSVTDEHVPDDPKQVKKDLQAFTKRINKELREAKQYHSTPFVDFSRIEGEAKGHGFGSAIYIYTARKLATKNKVLRGSGVQTDSAEAVWQRFKERMPDNVGFAKKKQYDGSMTTHPILDFRPKTSKSTAA